MNPFKHKQLEEFTIAECELYISKYPYGEHITDVKRMLHKLKNQKTTQEANKDTSDSTRVETEKKYYTSAKRNTDNKTYMTVNTVNDIDFDWIKFLRIIGTIIVIAIAVFLSISIIGGAVYSGPPIALIAMWAIRAIWKDS